MQEVVLKALEEFLIQATQNALFPIVGYGIDGDNMLLATTTIPELPYAMRTLRAETRSDYNLGRTIPRATMSRFATRHPSMVRLHEHPIQDLTSEDPRDVGRIVSIFGAPFFKDKAFALVDICGFSRLGHAEQLSQLYSLTNTLASSVRRTRLFFDRLALPRNTSFGHSSTGDGFYLWHDFVGGNADVATFMALVCIMTQAEAMRRDGFPMRLRAAYVIGSAFMVYDPDTPVSPSAVASNAIGEATNGAARLIGGARPSQILIGDFARRGQQNETMTPKELITQANELFREERAGAATLKLEPPELLQVTDKHQDPWYCYNVAGEVPNAASRGDTRTTGEGAPRPIQPIGLKPDTTIEVTSIAFKEEPWSA